MADRNENDPAIDTVLVANVTVHLQSGETFELLPFEDSKDVKSKVGDLVGDWAKSGFLIRGSKIYPWHQVAELRATEVLELPQGESRRRMDEWNARETERLQKSFWKTKQPREKKDEGEDDSSNSPKAA